MESDISRNTIFVLVILTLLVSVLGTWTVLTHVEEGFAAPPIAQRTDRGSGEVQFAIVAPKEGAVSEPATGRVVFEIQ